VTLSHQDKEHFFHEIAQLLRSGIPLAHALRHVGGGRGRAAAAARAVEPLVPVGLAEAMVRGGFSGLDAGILESGEQSGRLEEACRALADYHAHLAGGRRRALAAAAYPVFILHLGAVLLSIPPAILGGGMRGFFREAGMFLAAAYLAAGVLWAAIRLASKAFASNAAADRLVSLIPLAGAFFRCAALTRFCLVLSLGIRSADGVLASLARAGNASGSARLKAGADSAIRAIRSGVGLAESLRATGDFPHDLEHALQVAETAGRLDTEIARWAGIYRERLYLRIDALSTWLPRALYLLVIALIVLRMASLISHVAGIYSQALDF
jgi:MSHA biogenesis protein MshG